MVKIALLIIGIILIIWFLLPLISGRILNIGNVTGFAIGIVVFLYGLFFDNINRFLICFWQKGFGKAVEIIAGLIILAIIVLAVMTMLSMGSAASKKSKPNATVVVLGCRIKGDKASLMLTERLQVALDYLNEYPESRAIVSGGQGENESVAEADVMFDWLISKGIEPYRIIKEDKSTDTHENLEFCYRLLKNMDNDLWKEDIVIATNEFHEYRALKIAKDLGMEASPLPAKTAWWLFPTYYIREMYGILEDWFLV